MLSPIIVCSSITALWPIVTSFPKTTVGSIVAFGLTPGFILSNLCLSIKTNIFEKASCGSFTIIKFLPLYSSIFMSSLTNIALAFVSFK